MTASYALTGWFRQMIFCVCTFPCKNKIAGSDIWLSLGRSPFYLCKNKGRWVQGVAYCGIQKRHLPRGREGTTKTERLKACFCVLCIHDYGSQTPKWPMRSFTPLDSLLHVAQGCSLRPGETQRKWRRFVTSRLRL